MTAKPAKSARPALNTALLPSAGPIADLRAMSKRKRWREEEEEEVFPLFIDDLIKALIPGGRPCGGLSASQQVVADMLAFSSAMNDENLAIGVCVKRPWAIGPGLAAAEALGLFMMARLIEQTAKLMPPAPQNASQKSRLAWFDEGPGARHTKKLDSIFVRLLREENDQMWRGVMRVCVSKPDEFFRPRVKGVTVKVQAKAKAKPTRRPGVSTTALDALAEFARKKPGGRKTAGDEGVLDAAQDLWCALGSEWEEKRCPLVRRHVSALLTVCFEVVTDGLYIGIAINQPEVVGVALKAAQAEKLECASEILLKTNQQMERDDETLEERLAPLEAKMEEESFQDEVLAGVARMVTRSRAEFGPGGAKR